MIGEGRRRKINAHHGHIKKSKTPFDPKKLGPPPGTRPRILRLYR